MQLSELTFREKDHSYWLGEARIPSVNQLIDLYSDDSPTFYTEEHAKRGRDVHDMTVQIDLDGAPELLAPEEYDGYLAAYRSFLSIEKPTYAGFEEMVCYQGRYAGRYDRKAAINGIYGILDIKTGKRMARHDLQLAAYTLASGIDSFSGYILTLGSNGSYHLYVRDLEEAHVAWTGLINYHTYRKRNKI